MGTNYKQLSLRERIEIELLDRAGHSMRQIAANLGRAASTICRELARNAKTTKQWNGKYEGERAHGLALRRRVWDARHKLSRQPDLAKLVYKRLAMGWSPEQIAGRLVIENADMLISHESIYRYIYHRSAQRDYWHRLLARKKHRRGLIRRGGISPVRFIKHRKTLDERPVSAQNREQAGHWETDLMLFSKYGKTILCTHERHSRVILATCQPNKKAQTVVDALIQKLAGLPKKLRRTMTFDNGTEFAFHHLLHKPLDIQTFFCDPHAPWQKGGVENAIGRLRRALPRKTDLNTISQQKLDQVIMAYNNTPRKCLGFQTPAEVFSKLLNPLHFKHESTP